MKRILKLLLAVTLLVVLGHTVSWAQTNGASITVPSFTIPLPNGINPLVLVMIPLGAKLLAKILDGYEAKNPWLSPVVWLLEHVSLNQNVTPLNLRNNGLPSGVPITQGPVTPPKV